MSFHDFETSAPDPAKLSQMRRWIPWIFKKREAELFSRKNGVWGLIELRNIFLKKKCCFKALVVHNRRKSPWRIFRIRQPQKMKDENVSGFELPSQTSLTLLERVKRDENEAWNRLVDLYAPLIYARCRQRWKFSPTDAENIGQEVFLAVSRKIGEFQRSRTGSFRKWLRVIADNKCKDYLKGRGVCNSAGGSEARELLENVAEETKIEDETIEEIKSRSVVMQQALKVIENEFSQRDLEIFWKTSVEDRYRQDVAQEHGVSDNTVYIVISRIRKRLREIFEDLIDDDLLEDSSPG